jgi:hypothetical protein
MSYRKSPAAMPTAVPTPGPVTPPVTPRVKPRVKPLVKPLGQARNQSTARVSASFSLSRKRLGARRSMPSPLQKRRFIEPTTIVHSQSQSQSQSQSTVVVPERASSSQSIVLHVIRVETNGFGSSSSETRDSRFIAYDREQRKWTTQTMAVLKRAHSGRFDFRFRVTHTTQPTSDWRASRNHANSRFVDIQLVSSRYVAVRGSSVVLLPRQYTFRAISVSTAAATDTDYDCKCKCELTESGGAFKLQSPTGRFVCVSKQKSHAQSVSARCQSETQATVFRFACDIQLLAQGNGHTCSSVQDQKSSTTSSSGRHTVATKRVVSSGPHTVSALVSPFQSTWMRLSTDLKSHFAAEAKKTRPSTVHGDMQSVCSIVMLREEPSIPCMLKPRLVHAVKIASRLACSMPLIPSTAFDIFPAGHWCIYTVPDVFTRRHRLKVKHHRRSAKQFLYPASQSRLCQSLVPYPTNEFISSAVVSSITPGHTASNLLSLVSQSNTAAAATAVACSAISSDPMPDLQAIQDTCNTVYAWTDHERQLAARFATLDFSDLNRLLPC